MKRQSGGDRRCEETRQEATTKRRSGGDRRREEVTKRQSGGDRRREENKQEVQEHKALFDGPPGLSSRHSALMHEPCTRDQVGTPSGK